jgi:dTDP-4-amino-4,6-dideoxygalactose transaminase
MKYISYGRQYIDKKDIREVCKALKKDLITTGWYVEKLESEIKKNLGVKHIYTCNSGTSALFLAFMSIDLKENDNIIMPSVNFVAAANLAKFFKANIFLADVDKVSGHMTPASFEECIKKNKLQKIKAVITMYLGGYPIYINEFFKLKMKYNYYLIEDACHAFGAEYLFKNKFLKVGSCVHSDICTFSLHPVKTITSGEGGLIATNNKILAKKILLLRSHGIERKKTHWDYNVVKCGFNFRLSDMNCALGLSQLRKIKKILKFRKEIFEYYKNFFYKYKDIITFSQDHRNIKPSYHLVNISINFRKFKISKDNLLEKLKKNKIMCQFHYTPIYKFKNFKYLNEKNYFYGANYYHKNNISLPIHLKISLNTAQYVAKKLIKILAYYKN